MKAYVYIWFRPDWTPFYVGIGKTPNRWNPKHAKDKDRNPLCMNILRKYGVENIHVQTFLGLDWVEACAKEQSLIAHFGRIEAGGLLANFTDGGEGVIAPSKEVTKKRSDRLLDENNPMRQSHISLNSDPDIRRRRIETLKSPTTRKKISAALKQHWSNPENHDRRSEKMRAVRFAIKASKPKKDAGKKLSKEELRALRSRIMKERNADPEYQAKRIAALKNSSEAISKGVNASQHKRRKTLATPEVQAKLKRPKTAEHNRKVSEAKKLWWANRKSGIGHLVG